jgi:hypothetical protein
MNKIIASLPSGSVNRWRCPCCGSESLESVGTIKKANGTHLATYILRRMILSSNILKYKMYILITDDELFQGACVSASVVLEQKGGDINIRQVVDPSNPFGKGKEPIIEEYLGVRSDSTDNIVYHVINNDPFISWKA